MKQRQHRAMNCGCQFRQQQCDKWHAREERWLLKRMTQTYGSMESHGIVPVLGRLRKFWPEGRGSIVVCQHWAQVWTVQCKVSLIKGNNMSKGLSWQRSLLNCKTFNVGCRCLYFHKLTKSFKKCLSDYSDTVKSCRTGVTDFSH